MPGPSVFTRTASELQATLDLLRQREPIFHAPAFAASAEETARAVAEDYWEVGASGRRYSRRFILQELYAKPPEPADDLGWTTHDHALRRLGPQTYLLTYVLRQGERVTRRATVWEEAPEGWRVLYHQGTIVAHEEDDVAPPLA